MTVSADHLIWIDLEMTGLDTTRDQIIEIATLITDKDLRVLAEGPVVAIHQPETVLDRMDDWNKRQHLGSGLLERVRASRIDPLEAERRTLEFLRRWVPAGASPMCGNSICQDRRFLHRLMPTLEAYFHYRHIDVSTIKELARRWLPDISRGIKKSGTHLALDDIRDSVAELAFYRQHLFVNAAQAPAGAGR